MTKGAVRIEVFRDRLRLAWSWQGKRFWLYIGLPQTSVNRKAAEIKARQIELDIVSNNFDPSLAKYKPQQQQSIAVTELWEKFSDYKKRQITKATFAKYQGFGGQLTEFFRAKIAIGITETVAENFRAWLAKKLEPVTVRERIVMLNACWEWAIKKKLASENPWADIKVVVPPKQRPQPFTAIEIAQIVGKFRSDPNFSHYADYVEFKFGTGLRTGEAAALLWKHCLPDCAGIWIGESISGGDRKSTKTNKARTVPLTPRLQQILLNRRGNANSSEPIFTSPEGALIDSKNFCKRYWKPALAELGIEYRRPYTTRHTLISHGLEAGMNPVAIASLTGHDVRTLYENYAGLVSLPQLPDILPAFSSDFQVDQQGIDR